MTNILEFPITINYNIRRGPGVQLIALPRTLSYVYNKNTNLKSSYTTIYIPRYHSITPAQIKKYINGNYERKPALLEKAYNIFLSKQNLENFIKKRGIHLNSGNRGIITRNALVIIELFFRQNTLFHIGNKMYEIENQIIPHQVPGAPAPNLNCDYRIGDINKLRRQAHLNKRNEIGRENYDLFNEINVDPANKRHMEILLRQNIEEQYTAFMNNNNERTLYEDEYIDRIRDKSIYACNVNIVLLLKPKPITLKYLKNYYKNYRRTTCKTKYGDINKLFLDLCEEPGRIVNSDLWRVMCTPEALDNARLAHHEGQNARRAANMRI